MRRLAALAALAILVAACAPRPAAAPADPLAGSYLAAVSESAMPIAERLTAEFAAKHPGMKWTVRDVGSSGAVALVQSGEADAGFLTREVTIDEARRVQATGLGFSGQVIVVHRANPVIDLSADQLRGIFAGTITDWSVVGGPAGPIVVVLRPPSSPTRAVLDPLLLTPGAAYRPDAIVAPDAEAMLNTIASSPRAIGMVSALHLSAGDTAARAIAVAGVAPTNANVVSGAYAYRRPISLVVSANPTLLRPGTEAFRDFVHSEEGQRILRELF